MGILAAIKFNADFNHKLGRVDNLQRETADILAKFAADAELTIARFNVPKEMLYLRCSLVDNIPMSPKLALLCNEIRAVNPRVRLGINNNCAFMRCSTGTGNGHVTVLHEVWIYLPEQPYALMRLGYKNYTTTASSNGEPQYGVYSRLIHNRKYNSHNEQHCMLMSNDLARAVKNAKSVMRPYAPQETVQVKLKDFVGAVREETSEVNGEVSSAVYDIRHNSNLIKELVHMVESGYAFLSSELKGKVETYIQRREQQKEHMSKVRHGWFVTVLTRKDVQHFDVIEMFDVHKEQPVMHDPQTFTAETMPEELAGKMAVLSMVDVGARVSDVGMRATETTFYVERV